MGDDEVEWWPRKELVGKRFLFVPTINQGYPPFSRENEEEKSPSGTTSRRGEAGSEVEKRLSMISSWNWISGVIRRASSDDETEKTLKVLLEYDESHADEVEKEEFRMNKREWIHVYLYNNFNLFLLEENLVLAHRPQKKESPSKSASPSKTTSSSKGSSTSSQGSLLPALTFRPLVDKVSFSRSKNNNPVEFLKDVKLDFQDCNKLKIVKDWDPKIPGINTSKDSERRVKKWVDLQECQHILVKKPGQAIGNRVNMLREEGNNWFEGHVTTYDATKKKFNVLETNVHQSFQVDPRLVQMIVIGGASQLKESLDEGPRRSTRLAPHADFESGDPATSDSFEVSFDRSRSRTPRRGSTTSSTKRGRGRKRASSRESKASREQETNVKKNNIRDETSASSTSRSPSKTSEHRRTSRFSSTSSNSPQLIIQGSRGRPRKSLKSSPNQGSVGGPKNNTQDNWKHSGSESQSSEEDKVNKYINELALTSNRVATTNTAKSVVEKLKNNRPLRTLLAARKTRGSLKKFGTRLASEKPPIEDNSSPSSPQSLEILRQSTGKQAKQTKRRSSLTTSSPGSSTSETTALKLVSSSDLASQDLQTPLKSAPSQSVSQEPGGSQGLSSPPSFKPPKAVAIVRPHQRLKEQERQRKGDQLQPGNSKKEVEKTDEDDSGKTTKTEVISSPHKRKLQIKDTVIKDEDKKPKDLISLYDFPDDDDVNNDDSNLKLSAGRQKSVQQSPTSPRFSSPSKKLPLTSQDQLQSSQRYHSLVIPSKKPKFTSFSNRNSKNQSPAKDLSVDPGINQDQKFVIGGGEPSKKPAEEEKSREGIATLKAETEISASKNDIRVVSKDSITRMDCDSSYAGSVRNIGNTRSSSADLLLESDHRSVDSGISGHFRGSSGDERSGSRSSVLSDEHQRGHPATLSRPSSSSRPSSMDPPATVPSSVTFPPLMFPGFLNPQGYAAQFGHPTGSFDARLSPCYFMPNIFPGLKQQQLLPPASSAANYPAFPTAQANPFLHDSQNFYDRDKLARNQEMRARFEQMERERERVEKEKQIGRNLRQEQQLLRSKQQYHQPQQKMSVSTSESVDRHFQKSMELVQKFDSLYPTNAFHQRGQQQQKQLKASWGHHQNASSLNQHHLQSKSSELEEQRQKSNYPWNPDVLLEKHFPTQEAFHANQASVASARYPSTFGKEGSVTAEETINSYSKANPGLPPPLIRNDGTPIQHSSQGGSYSNANFRLLNSKRPSASQGASRPPQQPRAKSIDTPYRQSKTHSRPSPYASGQEPERTLPLPKLQSSDSAISSLRDFSGSTQANIPPPAHTAIDDTNSKRDTNSISDTNSNFVLNTYDRPLDLGKKEERINESGGLFRVAEPSVLARSEPATIKTVENRAVSMLRNSANETPPATSTGSSDPKHKKKKKEWINSYESRDGSEASLNPETLSSRSSLTASNPKVSSANVHDLSAEIKAAFGSNDSTNSDSEESGPRRGSRGRRSKNSHENSNEGKKKRKGSTESSSDSSDDENSIMSSKRRRMVQKKKGRRPKEPNPEGDQEFVPNGDERTATAQSKIPLASFLQSGPCFDVASKLPKCRECRWTQNQRNKSTPNIFCRFYDFRRLKYNNRNELEETGFCDPFRDAKSEDIAVWTPQRFSNSKGMNTKYAKLILSELYEDFKLILKQEQEASAIKIDKDVYWKRVVPGVREMCDGCETTLFNFHFTCFQCGFVVCINCYKLRKNRVSRPCDPAEKDRDAYSWLLCINNQEHETEKLHLVQIIAGDSLKIVANKLEDLKDQRKLDPSNIKAPKNKDTSLNYYKGQGCGNRWLRAPRNLYSLDSEKSYPDVLYEWLDEKKVLRLTEVDDGNNKTAMDLFRNVWKCGQPVVIFKALEEKDVKLWSPKVFSEKLKDTNTDFVNILNGLLKSHEVKDTFWKGYNEAPNIKVKEILQIKDSTSSGEMEMAFPKQLKNFHKRLPMKKYTDREGCRNLVSCLPSDFVHPDLGPKLHITQGLGSHIQTHCSIKLGMAYADSVNILMHCQPQFSGKRLIQMLEQEFGTLEHSVEKRVLNGKILGCVWQIFHPRDADKIRDALNERKGNNVYFDPLHGNNLIIEKEIIKFLEDCHKVTPFLVFQFEGEAVFIPAGAPRQAKHVQSSISVTQEFLSLEHISHSFHIINQENELSENQKQHGDELQIKNVIYHAVKESISVLSPTTRAQLQQDN